MIFIGYDSQGTDSPVTAIYELDGQRVATPANTPANQVEAAVLTALDAVSNPRPARAAYHAMISNNQDLLVYADYFFRAQRDLIAVWKTMPNLTDTTAAVYAAVRQNRAADANHLAMYTRFLWYVTRTTAVALVSGDLPASPSAAQAQAINAAAYAFVSNGFNVMRALSDS